MSNELDNIKLQLLQLQRSALIDTQTCLQLMLDKGICSLDDVLDARARIEAENEDVKKLSEQILSLGGTLPQADLGRGTKRAELQDQLKQLHDLIEQMGGLK